MWAVDVFTGTPWEEQASQEEALAIRVLAELAGTPLAGVAT
jgi:hypothetical protein